jgi:hypothetical protein
MRHITGDIARKVTWKSHARFKLRQLAADNLRKAGSPGRRNHATQAVEAYRPEELEIAN